MKPRYPRRAGTRWREGAPAYVLDSLALPEGGYDILVCGSGVNDPGAGAIYLHTATCGAVLDTGEISALDCAGYRKRMGRHRKKWSGLPNEVRDSVTRLVESWRR